LREKRTLLWCVELLSKRLEHWCRERLALLPDIKELLNLFLHGGLCVSYDPYK
jgi:hypothetical protein